MAKEKIKFPDQKGAVEKVWQSVKKQLHATSVNEDQVRAFMLAGRYGNNNPVCLLLMLILDELRESKRK